MEKETRERAAELAEVTDKFEKENADLRDRLGKEEAEREADVKELQVRETYVLNKIFSLQLFGQGDWEVGYLKGVLHWVF